MEATRHVTPRASTWPPIPRRSWTSGRRYACGRARCAPSVRSRPTAPRDAKARRHGSPRLGLDGPCRAGRPRSWCCATQAARCFSNVVPRAASGAGCGAFRSAIPRPMSRRSAGRATGLAPSRSPSSRQSPTGSPISSSMCTPSSSRSAAIAAPAVADPGEMRWYPPGAVADIGLAAPVKRLIEELARE